MSLKELFTNARKFLTFSEVIKIFGLVLLVAVALVGLFFGVQYTIAFFGG